MDYGYEEHELLELMLRLYLLLIYVKYPFENRGELLGLIIR